jgi:hypothetical protein
LSDFDESRHGQDTDGGQSIYALAVNENGMRISVVEATLVQLKAVLEVLSFKSCWMALGISENVCT